MPDISFMINLGDPSQVYDADDTNPSFTCAGSWWVGLQNRYQIVEFPAHIHVISVTFKPGGAYPFLQIPLSELQNQVISSEMLWGRFAIEIRERLYEAGSARERIALLERLLLARLRDAPPGLGAVQFAVNAIARQRGVLSIRDLSAEMGMSQKHLITQFKRLVGTPPKLLSRIYRFQHLLAAIDPAQPVNWAALAVQLSYHDQAHFSKDLRAFTGLSPGDYLRQRRQVLEAAPDYAQHLRHLPCG